MTLKHEQCGRGPGKVLVVHDWLSTIRSYDAVRPYLDDLAFSYTFVDLRGYGLNIDRVGEFTAAEAAADLVAVADELGWDRFHVVGHSMSGMVAQRLCVDARERVKSLVAVTPVSANGMPLDEAGTLLFGAVASSDDAWLTIARMVTSQRLPARWYAERLRQFRAGVASAACQGYLQMFAGPGFGAEMTGLTMPSMAILGRHDFMAFTEQAVAQTLARWFPAFEVQVIESAGHYPMSETPPCFVQCLESFLRAND